MTEVLITDRERTGRSALLWRDSDEVWRQTEGAPTAPMVQPEPMPPLPIIDYHALPGGPRVRILRLPIITRIRKRLAQWIEPR